MPSIAYIRQHYPEFNDYSDADIIDVANEFDISVTPDAPPSKSSNDRNFLTDTGAALESGALRVPGMMTGLLDIPFGYAGVDRPISRGWEAIGDRIGVSPGKLADEIDQNQLSDDLLLSRQNVDQAWKDGNALAIAQSYIDNPRVVADTVTRSIPAMLAGGLLGRAVVGAGTVGGAVGEGALSAGGAMDAIDDSASPEDRSTAALGSGLVVGAVSGLGGKIAGKLGLSDVDTLATGGNTVSHVARPLYQRVPLSALQEGGEEAVQSMSEKGFQNYAEGKPLTEGMARNTVEGMLAGNVMGFGAGFKAPKLNEAPPTLADLLNEARQQQADAEPQSASEAYTRAQERLSTIAESITGAEDIESALQAFHDSVATDILVAPEIDLSPTLQQELNNVQIENANYSNETGQGQQEGLLNAGTDPTVTDLNPATPEFTTPANLPGADRGSAESSPDALGNAEQGIENQGALAADHVPSPNLTEPTNDVFTSPIIENEPGIFGQESVSIDAPGDNTAATIQPSTVSTDGAADQGATQDHQQSGAVPQPAASELIANTLPKNYKSDLDEKTVKSLLPFNIQGNKSHLLANSIGKLMEHAAKSSNRVIDAFGGSGGYTHYLSQVGALPKGSILNEYDPMRTIAHKQIRDNPDAVLKHASDLEAYVKSQVDKLDNPDIGLNKRLDDAKKIRAELTKWTREQLKQHAKPGQDFVAKGKSNTPIDMQDSPELAGLYYFLQAQAFKFVPIQSDTSSKGNFRVPGFAFVAINKKKGKIQKFGRGKAYLTNKQTIIQQAASRVKDVDIRQGDGWVLIKNEATTGDLVTVDTSYLNRGAKKTANYSKATEEDAIPDVYLKKITDNLLPAWDRGAKLVVTNNWNDSVAKTLKGIGFQVYKTQRSTALKTGDNHELVALNFDPESQQVLSRGTNLASTTAGRAASESERPGSPVIDPNRVGNLAPGTHQEGGAVHRPGGLAPKFSKNKSESAAKSISFDTIPPLFLDSLKLSVKNSEGESTQMKFADVYSHVKEQMQAYADFITCVRG